MAAIFGRGNFVFKLGRVYCFGTKQTNNFDKIALSLFDKNSKIQNGHHFWKEEKNTKLSTVSCIDALWVKNFDKIAIKERKDFLCVFAFLSKILKFKIAAIFGKGKIFA